MNAFLRSVMQRRDAEHEATLLEQGISVREWWRRAARARLGRPEAN